MVGCRVKLITETDGEKTAFDFEAKLFSCDSFLRAVFEREENGEITKCEIIISRPPLLRVRIRQSGAISSDMNFEEGHLHSFDYSAGGLHARASLITDSLTVKFTQSTSADIKYRLEIDGQSINCKASIEFI